MSIRFPAELYARFRPRYPQGAYELLAKWMENAGIQRPADAADVGAGSGQFAVGLARSGLCRRVSLIEPDAMMLNEARGIIAREAPLDSVDVDFVERPSQATSLADQSVQLVTCASAFHWMPREETIAEFLRITTRPGFIYFLEYAFPISTHYPEFDSWIANKLNGEWQIPHFRSRVAFGEMFNGFRNLPRVQDMGIVPVPMKMELGPEALVGLLRSQSRYVLTRNKLTTEEAKLKFDEEVSAEVAKRLGQNVDVFDFQLKCTGFLLL